MKQPTCEQRCTVTRRYGGGDRWAWGRGGGGEGWTGGKGLGTVHQLGASIEEITTFSKGM